MPDTNNSDLGFSHKESSCGFYLIQKKGFMYWAILTCTVFEPRDHKSCSLGKGFRGSLNLIRFPELGTR